MQAPRRLYPEWVRRAKEAPRFGTRAAFDSKAGIPAKVEQRAFPLKAA